MADEFVGAGVSRRKMIAGVAWSVPVIVGVSATPAVSASLTPAALVWNNLGVWQASGKRAEGNYGIRVTEPGLVASVTVTLSLHDGNNTLETMSKTHALATAADGVQYTFQTVLVVGRSYKVAGTVSGTLTRYRGPSGPVDGTWTLTPISTTTMCGPITDW